MNDYELITENLEQVIHDIGNATYIDSDIEQLVEDASEKLIAAKALAAKRAERG